MNLHSPQTGPKLIDISKNQQVRNGERGYAVSGYQDLNINGYSFLNYKDRKSKEFRFIDYEAHVNLKLDFVKLMFCLW